VAYANQLKGVSLVDIDHRLDWIPHAVAANPSSHRASGDPRPHVIVQTEHQIVYLLDYPTTVHQGVVALRKICRKIDCLVQECALGS